MDTSQRDDPTVEELLDGEDLEFLRELAAAQGKTPSELAKEGIQEVVDERTRPRPVRGVLQPFRKK